MGAVDLGVAWRRHGRVARRRAQGGGGGRRADSEQRAHVEGAGCRARWRRRRACGNRLRGARVSGELGSCGEGVVGGCALGMVVASGRLL